MPATANLQAFTILAQDPAVRDANGHLVLTKIRVPHETLSLGPTGYRLKVVDFNASTNLLYRAHPYEQGPDGLAVDPFAVPEETTSAEREALENGLLGNPQFHCQNVYAIVMRTLARFEYALGRRVAWGFNGHQLHIVPHAFVDANAFYSKDDRALVFGYFMGNSGRNVFTCLSHDIVAHEATHAILDGLRMGFMTQSGPDQAGFHEGFADVVALLSVFSLKEIVELALLGGNAVEVQRHGSLRLVNGKQLSTDALGQSILFSLGKEFGQEMEGMRANALRRSVGLKPDRRLLSSGRYLEAHNRGEVFAAAMLRSMLELWLARIADLGTFGDDMYNLDAVVEEGAKVADHLLTIAIRALDYCPPLDLEFSDYLAALLTADTEVAPDDSRYDYRSIILKTFYSYGIEPPPGKTTPEGCWQLFEAHDRVTYRKTSFESMLRDCEEVFRFVWENRGVLGVDERAYVQVTSVRPSTRFGPDGFILRETVCEYTMKVNIFGAEVTTVCGIERPTEVQTTTELTMYGGGTLVFDQYGRIKFHVQRRLDDGAWQLKRLEYLMANGELASDNGEGSSFAELHRLRASADWVQELDEMAGDEQ